MTVTARIRKSLAHRLTNSAVNGDVLTPQPAAIQPPTRHVSR